MGDETASGPIEGDSSELQGPDARAQVGNGSPELLSQVYEELRKLAAVWMLNERADHTLQATALVHEAYARLVRTNQPQWSNRAHFFAAASEAMRRILVEHARAKRGPRRGGHLSRMPLDLVDLVTFEDPEQILALEEAMSRLEKEDAAASQVVRLRFYAGLSVDETSEVLGISPRTVEREWAFARVFLFREMNDGLE